MAGYLEAVWPDFWGAFLRFGWPRGPGKAFKNVGGEASHIFEGFPGPRGRPDPKKSPQKFGQTAFRYPVSKTYGTCPGCAKTARNKHGFGRPRAVCGPVGPQQIPFVSPTKQKKQTPNYPSATPTRLLPLPSPPPPRCFWGIPGAAIGGTQKVGQDCPAL